MPSQNVVPVADAASLVSTGIGISAWILIFAHLTIIHPARPLFKVAADIFNQFTGQFSITDIDRFERILIDLGIFHDHVGVELVEDDDVPTSFVYKKFSIPEPEEGDEIAKPTYGGGMGGVLPFKSDALLSLKAGADAPIGTQQHIDRLAAAALHKGVGSFKRAFEPVLKMIENADSLEQLRELMEDDTAVAELYAAMDVSEVEELLQKVMLYADLEGRVVEDG